jgi:hypothetical protein
MGGMGTQSIGKTVAWTPVWNDTEIIATNGSTITAAMESMIA